MPSGSEYDVHALRYFTRPARRDHEFFRYELYPNPSHDPLEMDYYFWLVKNDERTILVDCGFDGDRAAAKGRYLTTPPLELLARMDVRPEDVEQIIITHMHYDHVGNVEMFPNAEISMAREEYEHWTGPYGDRELMRVLVDPIEVGIVRSLDEQGRLYLIDGQEEIAPGIVARRVGGHTPGELIVEVNGTSGSLVLAADALHYYEEMELDRPYNLFSDLSALYAGYDSLRELDAREGTSVIAGHDPRIEAMFAQTAEHCFDLNDPIRER